MLLIKSLKEPKLDYDGGVTLGSPARRYFSPTNPLAKGDVNLFALRVQPIVKRSS
jgi:hypothetical protein